MGSWTRRQLTKTALALVSTSLLLLNLKPRRVFGQSCGNYNYYDPYDGGGGGPDCGLAYFNPVTGGCELA